MRCTYVPHMATTITDEGKLVFIPRAFCSMPRWFRRAEKRALRIKARLLAKQQALAMAGD